MRGAIRRILQIFTVAVIVALTVSLLRATISDALGVELPRVTAAITAAVVAAFVSTTRKDRLSGNSA